MVTNYCQYILRAFSLSALILILLIVIFILCLSRLIFVTRQRLIRLLSLRRRLEELRGL